jgi:hypothetical protein
VRSKPAFLFNTLAENSSDELPLLVVFLVRHKRTVLWKETIRHAACGPITPPELGRQTAVFCRKTVAL